MASQLTYNPFLPEVRADPYPTYRALRETDPVHRSPSLPMWVLTRYEHVALVLKDQSLSADRTKFEGFEPPEGFEVQQSMLTLDPPQHTRLRGLVNRAFTPRTVERLKPRIETLVEGILDAAERRGGLELVSFAYPLPVIAETLGVPAEDWPRFRAWSRVLAASLDPLMGRQDNTLDDFVAARNALASYLLRLWLSGAQSHETTSSATCWRSVSWTRGS
jgi:cytochrome P450